MADLDDPVPNESWPEPSASAPRATRPGTANQGLELLRLLVQSVRDYALFVLDPAGRVAEWNAGAQRLKGYAAEEIIGSHFSRFYPEADRAACDESLHRAAQHGSFELEGWRVRKDGSRFWASVVLTALRDESGKLVGFAKLTRDVTQRKQAGERLVQEKEAQARAEATDAAWRLVRTIAGIDDASVILQEPSGRLVFITGGATHARGASPAEALLTATAAEVTARFELFSADGRPLTPDQLPNRTVLGGKPCGEVLVGSRDRATNETRWTLIRSLPVLGADGRVAHVLTVCRDATGERHDEGQRGFLVDAIHQFNSSVDYRETLVNVAEQLVPALADWCAIDLVDGGRLERLAAAHVDPEKLSLVAELERRFPQDPNAPGTPRHVLTTGKPVLIELLSQEISRAGARSAEHLALLERLAPCSFLAVPITARKRPLGVLTLAMAESGRTYSARDVDFAVALADCAGVAIDNARLFQEQESSLANERRAREAAEQTEHFSELCIGVLGHDLRTPLNAIGVGAQYLARIAPDERRRRPAARILASTKRMSRMIDQLLDLTRIRLGGGFVLELAPADLERLLRPLLEETEAAFSCAMSWESTGDVTGTWDGDRLAQCVSNLLANAAKHGSGGAVLVRVDGSEAALVRLTVRNQGEIPRELLPYVFDPFRGIKVKRGAGDGLGLGLYIAKEIVTAHGGSIRLHSEQGMTELQIELPRVARAMSERGQQAPARGAS